ncbi:MAG: hypothetical protein U1C96_13425 [Gallionella sp.]|nr:hypothetical protein [Gallionella sp.]
MRFVSSIPPVAGFIEGREVKRISRIRAVTPVASGELSALVVEHPHQAYVAPVKREDRRYVMEERRKACRRVSHQPVLVELRSGIDRRHHNLREGDIVDHIDEEA